MQLCKRRVVPRTMAASIFRLKRSCHHYNGVARQLPSHNSYAEHVVLSITRGISG